MPGGTFAQLGAVIHTERIYWGVSSSPANTEAFIESLAGHQNTWTGGVVTFTVNADGTKKIYVARPTHMGPLVFNTGSIDGGFILIATGILVTNTLGLRLSYDLYESVDPGLGPTTVTARTGTVPVFVAAPEVSAGGVAVVAGGVTVTITPPGPVLPVTCAITAPLASSLPSFVPKTIRFTVSEPSTVVVKIDTTTIATVVVAGLSGSCSWSPQPGQSGMLTATATSASTGTVGVSPGVAITVTAPVSITVATAVLDSYIHDTLIKTPTGTSPNAFKAHNVGARYILHTSDTSLTFVFVEQDYTTLSIYVDRVWNQTIACVFGSNASRTITVTLPAGAKLVEIEEEGCSVTSIGSTGCSIDLIPYYAPQKRIIVYGTSIEASYYASATHLGWAQSLKRMISTDYSITNIAIPGSAAQFDNYNSTVQDALVASLSAAVDGTEETIFLNSKEVNDYGGASPSGAWSAASFQSAMTTLYGKLRTAYPKIQPATMAGFIRTNPAEGTPNSFGNTFADYRTAGRASTAAANTAAGLTFCLDLDGAAIGTLTYVDGLHPDMAGHAAIAAWAAANWFTS